jgi:hypothetical protein
MNQRPDMRTDVARDGSYTGWIIGAIVVLALIIGAFWYSNMGNNTSASNTSNAPAATTGAGGGSSGAGSPAPKAPASK